MAVAEAFFEILRMPTSWATIIGLMQFLGPVWIAFFLGVIVGWTWKPRWATLGNCNFNFFAPSSSSSIFKGFDSAQRLNSCKDGTASCSLDDGLPKEQNAKPLIDSSSELGKEEHQLITNEDLSHLWHLVERKDGGPPWKHMMDRCGNNMSYQAWQRDPECGPPQYCSRTVYEDATPELLRDFFWDDEFRLKWDDMLTHASILEECPTTGSMVVHWIRKFPFFCSDREYIIGRRIWESGRSYYCVTKGVPYVSIPRKDKPRRVDLYYSSWFIQAVESRKGNGELSACEVILFHHEDMGIPWEIAKFGVRQGMWGAVKTIERGFRAYQKHRASGGGAPLSRQAFMAQINTKVDPEYHLKKKTRTLEEDDDDYQVSAAAATTVALIGGGGGGKGLVKKIPKVVVIIGGAIAVACTLDRGLLTKTLIFGIAKKLGHMGMAGPPPRP